MASAIRTAALAPISRAATLFATSPDMFAGADAAAFARVSNPRSSSRASGADCYAYGLLAAGFIDLVVEATSSLTISARSCRSIEGAGGAIVDWQGRALDLGSDGRVIACGDLRRSTRPRRHFPAPVECRRLAIVLLPGRLSIRLRGNDNRRERPMRVVLAALFAFMLALPAAAQGASEDGPPSYGMSLFGDPLNYPPGFTHFDYVNPDAPKGGTCASATSARSTI